MDVAAALAWRDFMVSKHIDTSARHVPLDVLRDTIQPFPTFSEIYNDAMKALRAEIAAAER